MAHFAKLSKNNIVEQVIVVNNNVFSKSFRKNYEGTGMFFDEKTDSFIEKSCYFPSWILNEQTGLFEAPIKCPNDKAYWWNEKKQKWQDTPLTNEDYDIRLKSQNLAKEGELYTK